VQVPVVVRCGHVDVAQHDAQLVAPARAGPVQTLPCVLDDHHVVAERGGVLPAFTVVVTAFLDDREVEPVRLARAGQFRGVLLRDRQAAGVCVRGQEAHEGLVVLGAQQAGRDAGERVVVVRFDGLEALVRAFVGPRVHRVGDAPALGVRAGVEDRLAPVLVVHDVAGRVAEQQVAPLVLRTGLRLERVDVADVVEPGHGVVAVVAADHPGTAGRGVGAADLVVPRDVRRRRRDRVPGRG
jgi:hypothetical protein